MLQNYYWLIFFSNGIITFKVPSKIMKCQDLFSLKKKKMSTIAVVIGTRRGNICYGYSSEAACRGTSNEYTGDFIEQYTKRFNIH